MLADFPGTYTPRRTFPGETGAFKVSAKSTRGFIAGQNSFLRPERNSVPLGSGEEVVAFPAEGRSSANRFEIYFMRAIRGWAGRRPRAHPAGDISVDTQYDDKGRKWKVSNSKPALGRNFSSWTSLSRGFLSSEDDSREENK